MLMMLMMMLGVGRGTQTGRVGALEPPGPASKCAADSVACEMMNGCFLHDDAPWWVVVVVVIQLWRCAIRVRVCKCGPQLGSFLSNLE
jgi:hypothetical protein